MRLKLISTVNNVKFINAFAVFIIFLYYLPYLYFGEDSKISIHDNLDSNLSWVKILLDRGDLLSLPNLIIDNVFNGISRSSLYGTYDLSLIWFKLFGMYYGYIANKIIMSFVGYIGMYLLLENHILPKNNSNIINVGVSLCFALLPHWSFTLSVCGLPLAFYAFLNIRNYNNSYKNWLIIFLFPWYSSLVLSGIFFIALLSLVFVHDFIKSIKVNLQYIQAIIIFSFSYLLSHFPLVYSTLFQSNVISHRSEFVMKTLTFSESIKKALLVFYKGQFHAQSIHSNIIIVLILVLIVYVFKKKKNKIFIYSSLFIAITSLIYGLLSWGVFITMSKPLMDLIPIQLQRFHFLHPMLWYILFAISLIEISKLKKIGAWVVIIILCFQLKSIIDLKESSSSKALPSFRKFYAEELFKDIKLHINKPVESYRLISLGLHPAIAQYNGFYVLDGYYPNYPLKYKHKFKKVISEELEKDDLLKKYFNEWGSRCYSFSSEVGKNHLNSNLKKINKLDYDFKALKEIGGDYLLSSTEIDAQNNKEIKLLNVFKHKDSHWTIYLYENIATI